MSNLNTVKSFYCLKSFPGENIGVHWAPWSGCHGHFIDLGLSLPPPPDDSKRSDLEKGRNFCTPKIFRKLIFLYQIWLKFFRAANFLKQSTFCILLFVCSCSFQHIFNMRKFDTNWVEYHFAIDRKIPKWCTFDPRNVLVLLVKPFDPFFHRYNYQWPAQSSSWRPCWIKTAPPHPSQVELLSTPADVCPK